MFPQSELEPLAIRRLALTRLIEGRKQIKRAQEQAGHVALAQKSDQNIAHWEKELAELDKHIKKVRAAPKA